MKKEQNIIGTSNMNQVKEFYDIAELNAWLKEHDTDYEFKKIYRSTDQLYFVWYSFDPKISNEEFDEIDQETAFT